MRMQIEFGSGRVLEVDLDLDQATWNRLLQAALRDHSLLELEEVGGHTLTINPQQIETVRLLTGAGSTAPDEARRPIGIVRESSANGSAGAAERAESTDSDRAPAAAPVTREAPAAPEPTGDRHPPSDR